jgi:hypothetical protein
MAAQYNPFRATSSKLDEGAIPHQGRAYASDI